MATTPGLRERRKQTTRVALREAALRLALAKGFDGVRIDDIAEAAGVSPRTYNNYFSSKEHAVVAAVTADREARMVAALRDRRAETDLFDAVVGAVVHVFSTTGDDAGAALTLIANSRSLRTCYLETVGAIEGPLAQAILASLGEDHSDDQRLRAHAMAASIGASTKIALEEWLQWDESPIDGFIVPRRPLRELLEVTLAVLAPSFRSMTSRGTDA